MVRRVKTGEIQMNISNLSYSALFEVPVFIDWSEAFPNGRCQLIYPQNLQVETWDIEPMINYCYELPYLEHSPQQAQEILANGHVSCVVVELEDETVLALCGGGMDMSWDICKAYMLLGYIPPFHFCSLPALAGHEDNPVKEACMFSCEAVISRAESTLSHLSNL